MPVFPEPLLPLTIVLYYLLWNYRSRGIPQPPKNVKKNILKISIENCTIPAISGSTNPAIAMTCAAPEGTPPRRFNYLKTPPLASQGPVMDASRTLKFFMVG